MLQHPNTQPCTHAQASRQAQLLALPAARTSLANAENAAAKDRVLVIMEAPRPSMATAPSGSGVVMMPAMVARKMDSRCQALVATPAGGGVNHSAVPRPTQMASFFRSAPHLMPAAGGQEWGAGCRLGGVGAEAEVGLRQGRRRRQRWQWGTVHVPRHAEWGSPWGAGVAGGVAAAWARTSTARAGSCGTQGRTAARCRGAARLGRPTIGAMGRRWAVRRTAGRTAAELKVSRLAIVLLRSNLSKSDPRSRDTCQRPQILWHIPACCAQRAAAVGGAWATQRGRLPGGWCAGHLDHVRERPACICTSWKTAVVPLMPCRRRVQMLVKGGRAAGCGFCIDAAASLKQGRCCCFLPDIPASLALHIEATGLAFAVQHPPAALLQTRCAR